MRQVLLVLLFPVLLYGQSEFFKSDQSGLGVSFFYAGNSLVSGLGGGVGFSVLGKLDLGFEYVDGTIESESSSNSLDYTSYVVYTAYNIKRENDAANIKFAVGYLSSELNKSSYLFSFLFSFALHQVKNSKLMPSFGISFEMSAKNKSRYNTPLRSSSMSFGISFIIAPKKITKFHLTPIIALDLSGNENSVIYGINAGLMFSLSEI